MKTLLLLPFLLLSSCALSTKGLTKDQIAARERARAQRYNLYGQVLVGLALGAARGYAK